MRKIYSTLFLFLFFTNLSFSENNNNTSLKAKNVCDNGTCSYIKQDLGKGVTIEGHFNFNWDGKGTMEYNSKGISTIYSGDFENMLPHGEGVFTWPDGAKYSGQWVEGKKNGFGIFKDKFGLYVGSWKNDLRHGEGKIINKNGNTFVGNFIKNKKEGEGTVFYADGGKFIGQFKENLKNGYGIDFRPKGDEVRGNHINDLREGKTEIHLNDGAIVQYTFNKGNMVDGEGFIKTSNGKLFKGYWKNREFESYEKKNNKNLYLFMTVLAALGDNYYNYDSNYKKKSKSAFTKVCYYDGIGGQSALTVPSISNCPMNNPTKSSFGYTKVCDYPNSIGGPKAITVPSVSNCPMSYPE